MAKSVHVSTALLVGAFLLQGCQPSEADLAKPGAAGTKQATFVRVINLTSEEGTLALNGASMGSPVAPFTSTAFRPVPKGTVTLALTSESKGDKVEVLTGSGNTILILGTLAKPTIKVVQSVVPQGKDPATKTYVVNATGDPLALKGTKVASNAASEITALRSSDALSGELGGQKVKLEFGDKPAQCTAVFYKDKSEVKVLYLEDAIRMKTSLSGASAAG